MAKRKRAKDMAELTKDYEKFIAGKELNPKGKTAFATALTKAVKPAKKKKAK